MKNKVMKNEVITINNMDKPFFLQRRLKCYTERAVDKHPKIW